MSVSGPVRNLGGAEFVVVEQPLEPFRDLPAPLANVAFSTTVDMPVLELKKLFYARGSSFPVRCAACAPYYSCVCVVVVVFLRCSATWAVRACACALFCCALCVSAARDFRYVCVVRLRGGAVACVRS